MKKVNGNKGIARNKKPLKNIVYSVNVSQLKEDIDIEKYQEYKFKEDGYLVLYWRYEGKNSINNFHGFITPNYLKELIGLTQWSKFCQGKRIFIIQRRIDKHNINKTI